MTSDAYCVHLVAYIHRNPWKHGLVDELSAWPDSSYHAILTTRPTLLQRTSLLEWFGGEDPFRTFHKGALAEGLLAPLIEDNFD